MNKDPKFIAGFRAALLMTCGALEDFSKECRQIPMTPAHEAVSTFSVVLRTCIPGPKTKAKPKKRRAAK